MCLIVPLIVLEVIYIIAVASPIHLQSLKEQYKVFEFRLAVDAKDI